MVVLKTITEKKMQLNDLYGVVLTFVLIGVILAVGLTVLASLRDTTAVTGDAESAVNKTIVAVPELPNNWLLIIAVIVAAAIVIGLIVNSFAGQQR